MLHCFLRDEVAVLELSYKTIRIAYFFGNIYKCDCIKIFGVISWLDIIELLFYLNKTIIVFVTHCFWLWVS